MGVIIVYTGDGKGKTSACIGQAMRGLGNGMTVTFAQFFKKEGCAGEQRILRELLGERYRVGGVGFFRNPQEKERYRANALELLDWVSGRPADMVVLDEIIYALKAELLVERDFEKLLVLTMQKSSIFVLSGRKAPAWLIAKANIVTEMGQVRHHYLQGVPAMRGVEF